jgi:hypothetical protein
MIDLHPTTGDPDPSELTAMTTDSRMIPGQRVHMTDRCVHVGSGAKPPREPRVDLVRDAAGVRSIRITCRCGEVLCLDLDYSSKAA